MALRSYNLLALGPTAGPVFYSLWRVEVSANTTTSSDPILVIACLLGVLASACLHCPFMCILQMLIPTAFSFLEFMQERHLRFLLERFAMSLILNCPVSLFGSYLKPVLQG